ncbi:hypothetical protein EV424DRAFT_1348931 [Suillus variegatus]|nr:hypothetical protein EV424DRAFT_1348931 [Suillus variegatus]
MNVDMLYKAFKAVLASCEVTHLQVAISLWQVECAEHMTALNQVLHQENRARLNMKDEQLKKIRNFFSECHRTETDDNTNYPQAIYDDECEMLRAITAQADLISKCLGPGARHELLASTGEGPYLPRFVGTLKNRDSIAHALGGGCTDASTDTDSDTDSDSDHGKDDDYHSRQLGQQCSFGMQFKCFALFVNHLISLPHVPGFVNCGPQQKSKAKVPKPLRGSGLNPLGEPAIDQLHIPTQQLQMLYFAFNMHETTPQHGHSYSGTQSTGFNDQSTSQHGYSYSSMQSAGFDDQSTSQHGHSYSSTQSAGLDDQSTSQHGHSYSSMQSTGFNDQSSWDFFQNQPFLEVPSQGEIPQTDVMHINGGPSKTHKEMRHSTANATNTTNGSLPHNPPTDD